MTDERLESVESISPEEEHRLVEALRAAYAPAELDPKLNDLLVEQALEDPFAAPTDEEIAESERLRDALESGGDHPDAALARALAAALEPDRSRLDASVAARLERRALDRRRSNVIYVAFGVAALAAAVALVIAPLGGRTNAPSELEPPPLAMSRSAAPMFREPFETRSTSQRVDRIASSRERDLRDNRYALWGVSR